jgi:hypothetical protein
VGFGISFSVKGLEPVDSWRTWGGEKEVEPGGGTVRGEQARTARGPSPGSGGMLRARGFGLEPVDSWGGGRGTKEKVRASWQLADFAREKEKFEPVDSAGRGLPRPREGDG